MHVDIKRVAPRHYRILEMCLGGATRKEIAAALGVSKSMISVVTESPLFQDELTRRRKELDRKFDDVKTVRAMNILEDASVEAAEKQVVLMREGSEKISLQSANAILDRVLGGREANPGGGRTVNLTDASIQTLMLVVNEIKESKEVPSAPEPERSDVTIVVQ
jgi:hypothetical protein